MSVKVREEKNKREEKILFILSTQVTYIELYKLGYLERGYQFNTIKLSLSFYDN